MRVFSLHLMVFAIASLFVPSYVSAQIIDESSPAQDVGITFYKLTDQIPNFENWASYTQEYGTALEESKGEVLKEESKRLQKAFAFYDHTTTPLTIRTLANVSVKETNQPTLSITFPNRKSSYFPYAFGGENFALIVEKTDILSDISIGPLVVEQIRKRMPQDGQAVLVMNVVAYKANRKDSVKSSNLRLKPLLAKIGGLSLYNSDLETVWAWKADWYKRVMRGKRTQGNVNAIQN